MDRNGSSIRPLRQRTQRWRIAVRASAHADDRDQLNPFRPISPPRAAITPAAAAARRLLAQLKAQEEAISAATRKLRETQDTLNQLNKQIDEMNASIAKLERQRARRSVTCRAA
jgi:septal ring factor EnvC (AmiA/AmiB activator)